SSQSSNHASQVLVSMNGIPGGRSAGPLPTGVSTNAGVVGKSEVVGDPGVVGMKAPPVVDSSSALCSIAKVAGADGAPVPALARPNHLVPTVAAARSAMTLHAVRLVAMIVLLDSVCRAHDHCLEPP